MTQPSVRFDSGRGEWAAERESVRFVGQTDLGEVDFLITSEALVKMLNPEPDTIDGDMAIKICIELEADIHRIAQREFVSRLGGEPPMLLMTADVAA